MERVGAGVGVVKEKLFGGRVVVVGGGASRSRLDWREEGARLDLRRVLEERGFEGGRDGEGDCWRSNRLDGWVGKES